MAAMLDGQINLRFLSDKDPGGAVIRWWTWSNINHVEFVVPEGYLGARVIGGVKIRPTNYVKFKREYFAHIKVTKEEEEKILAFARSKIGSKYDWKVILGMGLKRDWDDPKNFICNELITRAFEFAGHPLFNSSVPHNRLSPRDLAIHKEVVFE